MELMYYIGLDARSLAGRTRGAEQKGNANLATLAMTRKLVAYRMVVDRVDRPETTKFFSARPARSCR